MQIPSPLVSVDWLYKHIEVDNLVVLDATIPKVTQKELATNSECIPKALFFDIKNKFSDLEAEFPNTLPSPTQFEKQTQLLGINSDSIIIVYDSYGMYASARAWWLFKNFGHNNSVVLNGGLPQWKLKGYKTDMVHRKPETLGNFKVNFTEGLFTNFEGINKYANQDDVLILDARSKARFTGEVPEPRKRLRSGTIPNSVNLPYTELLNGTLFRSIKELKEIYNATVKAKQKLVFTCGSGVTACNLALGATLAGYKNLVVYDGSWTEYGTLTY